MHFDFATVLAFALAAVGFGVVNLTVGRLLRPTLPTATKDQVYECGEVPVGGTTFHFHPRFAVVALVFVIFEIEIAITLPVASALRAAIDRGQGTTALAALVSFVAVLAAGLVWVLVLKELEWVKGGLFSPSPRERA